MRPLIIILITRSSWASVIIPGGLHARATDRSWRSRATYANYQRVNSTLSPPLSYFLLHLTLLCVVFSPTRFLWFVCALSGTEYNAFIWINSPSRCERVFLSFFFFKQMRVFSYHALFFQRQNNVASIARPHHYSQRMPTPNKFSFRN